MKVLFVNPHRSDFVYNSPVYLLLKRKSLKKYQYLDIFFKQHDTDFIFITSSLVRTLSFLKIRILDILFLMIEKYFFKKINITNNSMFYLKNNKIYDITFCFGFAIRDLTNEQFKDLVKKSKLLIIHLSHYHIYANKLNEWASNENVVFCADADITNTYFYNYFLNKKCPFFVLTYSIDPNKFRFLNPLSNRESKIICTGTFHEFEKMYKNSFLKTNPISNIFGYLTIHPERRILYYFKDKLQNILIFNTSMGKIDIFKFFKKKNSINQSNYFSFNIVDEYNKYRFAFIGEESIVGLPGIGVFEAILCGCIPIINDFCYIGTPLENSNVPIKYKNINNLYNIINSFESGIANLNYSEECLQSFRTEIANFYSASNQLHQLNKFLKI